MPAMSVGFGTVEVFDAIAPHPMASWEPGNIHLPLRISTCLDETGILMIHVDTAVTLHLADNAPPFELYIDGGHVYGDLTGVDRSARGSPDHGHPVPWRVAAGGAPRPATSARRPASGDREEPAAATATERPDATGAA